MSGYWIGMLVGLWIGAPLGYIICGLMMAGHRDDVAVQLRQVREQEQNLERLRRVLGGQS